MFIIGYWCDCQEQEQEQEQEQKQEQDILTVGKEIYEHRYCTYEKLALKLARQTNAGQTDRQTARTEPTWEEDPVSGTAQNFCFLFGFRFVLFLFFFLVFFPFFCIPPFWLVSCIVYSSGPSIFTLFTLIFLCRAFCFMLHSVPSHHASAAAGNLFDCWSACISLYFFGYVCRSRREREREKGRGGERGWCIYFVSTCSWYLFYESNYLYWNMAYTWDSCVVLRHIFTSICYFWRACAEILCCSSW